MFLLQIGLNVETLEQTDQLVISSLHELISKTLEDGPPVDKNILQTSSVSTMMEGCPSVVKKTLQASSMPRTLEDGPPTD